MLAIENSTSFIFNISNNTYYSPYEPNSNALNHHSVVNESLTQIIMSLTCPKEMALGSLSL